MRRNVTAVLLVICACVTVGLGIPLLMLARSHAEGELRADRQIDLEWFAAVAQRPIADGSYGSLSLKLDRYRELYGMPIVVTDSSGRIVAGAGVSQLDIDNLSTVGVALAGRIGQSSDSIWPWSTVPVTIAVPVQIDARTIGSVVSQVPTTGVRAVILKQWLLIAAVLGVAAAIAVAAVHYLTRWIVDPIARLELQIAERGELAARGRWDQTSAPPRGPPELATVTATFDRVASRLATVIGSQREFVADAGHSLQNPLTALRIRLSSAATLVADDALDELGPAIDEVDRLIDITNGLLVITRSESPVLEVISSSVDLAVRDRVVAWRPLAATKNVDLRGDATTGEAVLVEADLLQRVLDPLIDNAIRFAPAGSEVLMRGMADSEIVCVSLRDHGPGLGEDEKSAALQRFWRGSGQSASSGTGLGLSIADALVRRNGGWIELSDPESGSGLVVSVNFPRLTRVELEALTAQGDRS